MAQEIWDGPTVTFEKLGGSDASLEENQDRIMVLIGSVPKRITILKKKDSGNY